MHIDSVRVRIKMAEQGKTQRELAEKAGVHPGLLSTVLSRGTCNAVTATKVALALGVPTTEILRGGGD